MLALARRWWFVPAAALLLGGASSSPDSALDKHALDTPEDNRGTPWDVKALTAHLTAQAKNDRQKVRVLFRWVADRVAYDVEGYAKGGPFEVRPEAVVVRRKAVCDGYAQLFRALCEAAGVEVAVVRGYCKGYGHFQGEKISTNHAWNAVRIDGTWHLVDTTWAAGAVDGKEFKKNFREFYYLTPADRLIFTHFPDDPKWQLLERPASREEFEKLPDAGARLFELGFTPEQLRAAAGAPGFKGLVQVYIPAGGTLRVVEAPAQRHLKAGATYRFRIESPDIQKMYVVTDKGPREMLRRGRVFEANVTAAKKTLKLSHTIPGDKSGTYWSFLSYEVE
jgi:hypothetical protein